MGEKTMAELQAETLTQKHMRLMQEKCPHEETYTSSCYSAETGINATTKFCFDCGKSWHTETPRLP